MIWNSELSDFKELQRSGSGKDQGGYLTPGPVLQEIRKRPQSPLGKAASVPKAKPNSC